MKLDNISKDLIYDINNLIKHNDDFRFISTEIDHYNQPKHLINFFLNYYKVLNSSKEQILTYFENTNKIHLREKYYKNIIINKNNNNFNKYLTGDFISYYKKSIIQKSKKCKIVIAKNIDISFYYENDKINNNIDEIIYYLLLIYYTISKIYNYEEKLNLIIFYLDFKKFTSNNSVSYININSGYSYKNNIILFRKEELFKVFIHEVLHVVGLDNKYNLIPSSQKLLSKIFHIQSEQLYNEGYIEFSAIIYHSLFISFIFTKNFNSYKNLFQKLIKYEILFSYIQLSKILNIYNLSPYDFFEENNYTEDTNTFSYFYLKLLMLEKYSFFIERVLYKNKIFYFNEAKLYKYIIYLLDSKSKFLSNILENIDIIQNILLRKCNNNTSYFCKNLRLSLLELYI